MQRTLSIVSIVLLVGLGITLVQAANYNVPPYTTIQAAINAAPGGTTINVAAGTYRENVIVNKSLTIIGVGSTTIISPSSGIGIKVTANNVTLQNLKVSETSGSGIYAANVSGLKLTSVTSDSSGSGSGVDVKGITGTSVFTNVTANDNHTHGLAIGNGSTGVSVIGGTFTGNGQAGDQSTGGGIIVYADEGMTTSGTSISGTVNSNTNKTAGIYLYCDADGTMENTTIGATGTITLNDNGSSGYGGAAVIVYGPCDNTQITANSTKSVAFQTAGLVVVGTNGAGDNSPTNTVVKNCTLSGFDSNSPAGTMWVKHGTDSLLCNENVDATVNNMIDGVTTGYQVEDMLVHKVDDSRLGIFLAPGNTIFVTPNSGSIQRGIAVASTTYDTVQVEDGTYNENVTVDKAIVLSGQGASTIIKPSSGTAVNITHSGVTLENLHIYLSSPFAPTVAPTAATNNTFTFPVQVKVFLQGPYYSSDSMKTTLATAELIPLSQQYTAAPFSYEGTEAVGSTADFTANNVVDWILVELRSTKAGAAVARRAALLKRDGTVLDADLSTGVKMTETFASGYDSLRYVVIKHRNHLAVMSKDSIGLPNASAYDFTTAQTKAYGVNPMLGLGSIYGMFAGDYNRDGQITTVDYDAWLANTKAGLTGYVLTDFNLDGQVTTPDYDQWLANTKAGAQSRVP